jgi:5-enolpyruvylshikimate-3-phosphate synthase
MSTAAEQPTEQAKRAFAIQPPMSREQAIDHLAAPGVRADAEGKRIDGPREHTAAEYHIPADAPIAADDIAKLAIDPTLARVLVADLGAKVDPAAVEAHIQRTGGNYRALLGDVTALLASNGVKLDAAKLSAHTLSLLAAHARYSSRQR